MSKKYWYCIIGPIDEMDIPDGGDITPRMAVRAAIEQEMELNPDQCLSGWLSEDEIMSMGRPGRIRKN